MGNEYQKILEITTRIGCSNMCEYCPQVTLIGEYRKKDPLHVISDKSDIVIFICDIDDGVVDQDMKILNMIIDNGKPVLFALNKVDLVSKKELKTKYLSKKMQSEFLRNIEQVEISALNKKGFNRVF